MHMTATIDLGFLDDQRAPATAFDAHQLLALQTETDAIVERFGAPGSHPEITAAAGRWSAAWQARDAAGCRAACAEVQQLARQLTA